MDDRMLYRFRFRVWDGTRMRYGANLAGDNRTLMQCTGLKDRDGRDIYEGDIVVQERYPWFDEGRPSYRSTVEWIYSQWQAVYHCVHPAKRGISDGINVGLNDEGIEDGECTAWKVVGTIYEQPELLVREEGTS